MLKQSFARALWAQLHPKMWLLSIIPMLLTLVLWAIVLKFTLGPLIDQVQAMLSDKSGQGMWLLAGLVAIKAFLAPVLALWLILPLIMLTTLVIVGSVLMPFITRFVAARDFAGLERKQGGTTIGGVLNSLLCFGGFFLLWLLTLPLALVPFLGIVPHTLLWGWLTCRVMVYDALAEHASEQELQQILRQHRWQLLAIGTITSLIGNLPTALWLGGALAMILLPVTATLSIWLYLIIFIFSGLWFQYYVLAALQEMRQAALRQAALPQTSVQASPLLTDDQVSAP